MIRITNVHTIESNSESIIIDKQNSFSNLLNIHFDNAIVFPGLINSHDHLEFNLFPQLGNYFYKSYMEWGPDIHNHDKEVIQSILRIPKELRAQWGIYKNLLAGITTVVQHGERMPLNNEVITIFQDCYSLHSVRLEKLWKLKLNKPFSKDQPYAIHIGEGTNDDAFNEINELIKWNLLKRKLVGIHGIAMNTQQAKTFEALVWCPDSNFFLYNATAKIDELKKVTKILFGSDSTLSANWNMWEHLRKVRITGMLTDIELLESLTSTAALVWNIPDAGSLRENMNADIVVAARKNNDNWFESFFSVNPEDILLVLREGNIVLFDERLKNQLTKQISQQMFSKLWVNGVCKYVKGDLPGLIKKIKRYNPSIRLPVEIAEL